MEIKFRVYDSISDKIHQWHKVKSIPLMNFNLEHYTLEQFTSLRDAYGVEIYEGDIVNFTRSYGNWQIPESHGYITDVCEIIYDTKCCRFALSYKSNIQKLRVGYEYEVIGNIHENAELLTQK